MTGYVYVIGSTGSGLVKIGRSTNLARRLAAIQTTCPTKVEVLWQTEGGSPLERTLHKDFQHLRTHGEWFNFGKVDAVAAVREAVSRPRKPARQAHGFTPVRNVRVPDEVWDPALANAKAAGTDLTKVIVAYLKRYNAAATRRRESGADDE